MERVLLGVGALVAAAALGVVLKTRMGFLWLCGISCLAGAMGIGYVWARPGGNWSDFAFILMFVGGGYVGVLGLVAELDQLRDRIRQLEKQAGSCKPQDRHGDDIEPRGDG